MRPCNDSRSRSSEVILSAKRSIVVVYYSFSKDVFAALPPGCFGGLSIEIRRGSVQWKCRQRS
jgi:hypothetical protein